MPIFTVAKSKKLRAQWFGPFKVVAVHSPVAVELDLPAYLNSVHPVVHPQYLKPTARRRCDAGVRAILEAAYVAGDVRWGLRVSSNEVR